MTTTETTDPAQGDTVTEDSAHEDGSRGVRSDAGEELDVSELGWVSAVGSVHR